MYHSIYYFLYRQSSTACVWGSHDHVSIMWRSCVHHRPQFCLCHLSLNLSLLYLLATCTSGVFNMWTTCRSQDNPVVDHVAVICVISMCDCDLVNCHPSFGSLVYLSTILSITNHLFHVLSTFWSREPHVSVTYLSYVYICHLSYHVFPSCNLSVHHLFYLISFTSFNCLSRVHHAWVMVDHTSFTCRSRVYHLSQLCSCHLSYWLPSII